MAEQQSVNIESPAVQAYLTGTVRGTAPCPSDYPSPMAYAMVSAFSFSHPREVSASPAGDPDEMRQTQER